MSKSNFDGNRPCDRDNDPTSFNGWIHWGSGYFKAASVVAVNVNAPQVEVVLDGGYKLLQMCSSADNAYAMREELVVLIDEVQRQNLNRVVNVTNTSSPFTDADAKALRRLMERELRDMTPKISCGQ